MDSADPRNKMIVALDLPDLAAAEAMVTRLGDSVTFYKIGLELVYAGGMPLAERLIASGKNVFLDLKLHDIPNTVGRATAQIAKMGAHFLTIHAFSQTMRAARESLGDSSLKLLAVTVMTSYDDNDLAEAGYRLNVKDLVAHRAQQAKTLNIHGLILSAEEASSMRAALGPDMLLVTPGIRPMGADIGDQKRVMTPARAIAAGADHLVIGRPITQASDPRAAAEAIVKEIAGALHK